jgi:hypothetical protein
MLHNAESAAYPQLFGDFPQGRGEATACQMSGYEVEDLLLAFCQLFHGKTSQVVK